MVILIKKTSLTSFTKHSCEFLMLFANRGRLPVSSGERLNGIQEVSGSIPLISTKGKASQNLDVQGLRGFFLLLLQGCKLEINGRKKKKYEQFFRTFFVQLHFIFSTYSFRPFATSCMRVWRICVYISLVVWILLCPISSCVAFSSTLAS